MSWLATAGVWIADNVKGLIGGKGTTQIGKDNKTSSSSTTGDESPAISALGNVNFDASKDSRTTTATGPSAMAVGGDVNAPVSLQATIHYVSQPPSLQQILFTLPTPLSEKFFIGRGKETARIRQILNTAKGGRAALTAVKGMGGIGKSVLAVYVANKIRDKFPDGQFFIPLNGIVAPVSPLDVMSCIIRSFHSDFATEPQTIEKLQPVYLSVLANKKVLIVLDNARDATHVRPLLPPVGCGLIVTSRQSLDSLDGIEPITLEQMSSDESLKLFRSLVGSRGTDDELRIIADLCGFLPLALNVAGSFLKGHKDWSFQSYIDALQKERLKRLKVENDPTKDVEAVLALSASQLVRDKPEFAAKWQELSVFKSDFELIVASAVLDAASDQLNAQDVLAALQDRSLILYDEMNKRYRIHDLFHEIARTVFDWGATHDLNNTSAKRLDATFHRYTAYSTDLLARTVDILKGTGKASESMKTELPNLMSGLLQAARGVSHLQDGDAYKHKTANDLSDLVSLGISKLVAASPDVVNGKALIGSPEMAESLINLADQMALSGRYQNALDMAVSVSDSLTDKDSAFATEVTRKIAYWRMIVARAKNG